MILTNSRIKILATLLVKNEEDIIGKNIEHHIKEGVTQFIITNNDSSDRTKQIIAQYPEVVQIIDEKDNTHNQSVSVTRMARLACDYNPDWIIHLDADELWCGLTNLKNVSEAIVSSTGLYLHPPYDDSFNSMRHYLDFDHIPNLPMESKIAHRPNPNIIITHGNHGCNIKSQIYSTKSIYRHHYPVRSFTQFQNKTILGHEALKRRNSICTRWENWYNIWKEGELYNLYEHICILWRNLIQKPNKQDFLNLIKFWSPSEVLDFFNNCDLLPIIREWPKYHHEK